MEKLKADNATQLAALKLESQNKQSTQQRALAERLTKRRQSKVPDSEQDKRGTASNPNLPDEVFASSATSNFLPAVSTASLPAAASGSTFIRQENKALSPWQDVDF